MMRVARLVADDRPLWPGTSVREAFVLQGKPQLVGIALLPRRCALLPYTRRRRPTCSPAATAENPHGPASAIVVADLTNYDTRHIM